MEDTSPNKNMDRHSDTQMHGWSTPQLNSKLSDGKFIGASRSWVGIFWNE